MYACLPSESQNLAPVHATYFKVLAFPTRYRLSEVSLTGPFIFHEDERPVNMPSFNNH